MFFTKKTSKMNAVSNRSSHLEKGIYFSKGMLLNFKEYYDF
jgi:hypothetical protein